MLSRSTVKAVLKALLIGVVLWWIVRHEQDRLFAAAASFAPGDADCVRRNIELLLAAHAVSASEFPAALATASSAYAGVRDGGTRLDRAARAD